MSAADVPPTDPSEQPQGPGPGGIPPEMLSMLDPATLAALTGENLDPTGVDEEALGGFYDPEFFGTQEFGGGFRVGGQRTFERPFYKNGDEWRVMQGLPPEEFRSLQERLAFVGLLDDYRPGEFDPEGKTLTAIRTVLAMSNRRGSHWKETISEFETNIQNGMMEPFGADEGQAPQAPSFEAVPDYTTLKRRVIRQFRDRLGRDPTQAEVKMFSDEMMSDFTAQAQRDFQRRADTRDVPDDVGAAHVPVQQEIDPVARFEESFEQRMGGQLETLEKQANTGAGAAAAQQNVAAADQIAGT